jgi:hypothetical protein
VAIGDLDPAAKALTATLEDDDHEAVLPPRSHEKESGDSPASSRRLHLNGELLQCLLGQTLGIHLGTFCLYPR